MAIDPAKTYDAILKTEKGDIKIRLRPDLAPKHVESFVKLARSGFYDGVTFHRVIEGFMAQTGDPTGTGTGGPGYTRPRGVHEHRLRPGRRRRRAHQRPEQRRQPVLHHLRQGASPRRPVHSVRRGLGGYGRRRQRHAARPVADAERAGGRQDRLGGDRRGVATTRSFVWSGAWRRAPLRAASAPRTAR